MASYNTFERNNTFKVIRQNPEVLTLKIDKLSCNILSMRFFKKISLNITFSLHLEILFDAKEMKVG
jgi:hypothetical protein